MRYDKNHKKYCTVKFRVGIFFTKSKLVFHCLKLSRNREKEDLEKDSRKEVLESGGHHKKSSSTLIATNLFQNDDESSSTARQLSKTSKKLKENCNVMNILPTQLENELIQGNTASLSRNTLRKNKLQNESVSANGKQKENKKYDVLSADGKSLKGKILVSFLANILTIPSFKSYSTFLVFLHL